MQAFDYVEAGDVDGASDDEYGDTGAAAAGAGPDRLSAGQQLGVGQQLSSPNGQGRLVMQRDGNLVIYTRGGAAIWDAKTAGKGGVRAVMQTDGNFVVYDAHGRALWSSQSGGHPGAYLRLQDDGNLVVYLGNSPLWNAGTTGWHSPPVHHGWISNALHSVEHAAASVGKVVGKVTNNPLWKIAATGASFIPGIGTAVSAGMSSAAAFGRGESLKDIGLAAVKGALPGGPEVQAAFDIGVGALKGHNLGAEALREVRAQLPGGEDAKGAFDAAVMIASNAGHDAKTRLASTLSSGARQAYQTAIAAHAAGPQMVSHGPNVRAIPGRTQIVKTPLYQRPPEPRRPFPSLTGPQNKVASVLVAQPQARSVPAAQLAKSVAVDTKDARNAIAAFLQRFGSTRELDYRDVGEFETFDQAARRHNVTAKNLGEWPSEDTGALHVMAMPPLAVDRKRLHRLYQRGDSNIKRALLAHELLAHVARNTGELEGTTWVIQANGDWPSKVAATVVGDGNRWKEILPLNPDLHLQSNGNIPQWTKGRVINLPPSWVPSAVPVPAAPTPGAPPAATPSAPTSYGGPPFASAYPLGYPSSVYPIKNGDTGEKVSALITGDKNRWRELLTTNPKLADPKYGIALYAGKTLVLPTQWVKPQASPGVVAIGLPSAPTPAAPPVMISPAPSAPPTPGGGFGAPPAVPPFVTPGGGSGQDMPITTSPGINPVTQGPVVTGSAEQIGTVQLLLAAFYRTHPEATYGISAAPFGTDPADLAGVWTDRTTSAFMGFETWWNARHNSPSLVADGLPDGDAVAALFRQDDADGSTTGEVLDSNVQLTVRGVKQKAATAPTKKSSGGDFIVPLGLILAALGS